MYIPGNFAEEDRDRIFELMRQHSFGTLVTVYNGAPLIAPGS